MAARIAFGVGVLSLLLAAGFFGRVSDHTYDLVIVGNASTGYSVRKNTTRFEVDYNRRTTWRVTSTADVARDFQIDGLSVEAKCRIRFRSSDSDPSSECKTKRATITPNAPAVVYEATARSLWPQEYYLWWNFGPLYKSDVLTGAVGATNLAPSDPDLELEREYGTLSTLAILLGLLSLGYSWWSRKKTV